jgi:hypothetical protein
MLLLSKIRNGFWWVLLGAWTAHAGQYQLLLGQTQSVPIAVQVRNKETQCNLQLQVSGQPPIERVVKAPLFETRLAIRADQPGAVQVHWMGVATRTDAGVVNACPTEGQTELAVVNTNEALVAQWNALFARLGPSMTECVRLALAVQQVRPEWFDLKDRQSSGEDAKIDTALQQCEVFLTRNTAWGSKDPVRHACTLSSGLKTECEGYYAEPGAKGAAAQSISKQQAIARQLQGLPWVTAVREHPLVKAQRLRREHAEQQKQLALAAAKLEAEARQQQEEEAKRQAEAKAQAEQEEAEKAREAAEKEQAEKERLEKRSWFAKTYDGLKQKVGAGAK